eukprot:m.29217 g.29217  ORF g.29217 m.29217 type:complete len:141 (-) comp16058_c0_seq1:388-810(-)
MSAKSKNVKGLTVDLSPVCEPTSIPQDPRDPRSPLPVDTERLKLSATSDDNAPVNQERRRTPVDFLTESNVPTPGNKERRRTPLDFVDPRSPLPPVASDSDLPFITEGTEGNPMTQFVDPRSPGIPRTPRESTNDYEIPY